MGKIILQDPKGNKVILSTNDVIKIKHHPDNTGMTVLDQTCTLVSLDTDELVPLEDEDQEEKKPEAEPPKI